MEPEGSAITGKFRSIYRRMAMFIFDNRSEFFRYPQGGVKAGQEITLKIYVKKNLNLNPAIKIEKRHDFDRQLYKEVPMEWTGAEKSYDLYKGVFSVKEPGHYFYSFVFGEHNSPQCELLIYAENYTTPGWIKGGIIYHIFVDRFYKTKVKKKKGDIVIRNDWGGIPRYLPGENGKIENNDFFGGSLEGIKEKLPYLSSLGVTAVYLSPIFDAYSNHKYDVGDYFSIDTMFGDEKSLAELCKEAESRGISIILDGVFSHTGADSIYFNKYGHYNSTGAYHSKDSPYYGWYIFNKWNEDYACWWGIRTLPAINKSNENYIDFIAGDKGVLRYWQGKGIKGWRLDVADELPNEFIEKLRKTVKDQDKGTFIAGEVWEDASDKFSYGKLKEYFCGNQLDSVTNYPLRNGIIEYVKNRDCALLNETMNSIVEKYPPQTVNCLMNILGTHDTPRILTVLGSGEAPSSKSERAVYKLTSDELNKGIKLLKIASLLQFTLPGVPCVYYGDEAGAQGFEDPFNRGCFPWGNENSTILNHYKFLSVLRKNKLFAEGRYKNLIHDGGVFVFERYDENGKIIVAANMSEETITLNFKEKLQKYTIGETGSSFNLGGEEYLVLFH